MGRKSRVKGARFELEASKLLKGWWGCPFERTTTHGGSTKKDLPGDLVAINPLVHCPFCFEAKHDENLVRIEPHLRDSRSSGLASILEQTFAQAEELKHGQDLIPALICKRNFFPILMLWPHDLDLGVERMMLRWDREGCSGFPVWLSVALFEEVVTLNPERVSRAGRELLKSFGDGPRPWNRTVPAGAERPAPPSGK